jgi:lipopolysaccharide/colanic/teichoic acid biosynthesis glycosyltransferase
MELHAIRWQQRITAAPHQLVSMHHVLKRVIDCALSVTAAFCLNPYCIIIIIKLPN